MQTRFRMVSFDGEAGATENTRAAAAIYALDVPLNLKRTLTTIAGDGISGQRVTWHFEAANSRGESSSAMVKAWNNSNYHAKNPDCPLVNIKAAFLRHAELVRQIKEGTLECKAAAAPFITTACTKTAAAMEQLGHPIQGIAWHDGTYHFRFSQAAASDFALWHLPPGELEKRLPDALISYLWCAFDNHRVMVDFIKREGPQFAAVKHKGRTALIGKDQPKAQVDQLERLLYRR